MERQQQETWSAEFIGKLLESGQLDGEAKDALIVASAGRPSLRVNPRLKVGQAVTLTPERPVGMRPYTRFERIGEVRLDGKRLEPAARPSRPGRDAGMPESVVFDTVGEHLLEFDVEWIVVPREGSSPFNDARAAVLDTPVTDPEELRQRGVIARRKETIVQRITVLPASETIVEPVVDAALRRPLRDGVSVTTARITRKPVGDGLQLELAIDPQMPPNCPSLMALPVVQIGPHTIRGVGFVRTATERGVNTYGAMQWRFDLPDLAPEVATLRLTLEPDLDNLKLSERAKRAWGEAIVVENVAVDRIDLGKLAR